MKQPDDLQLKNCSVFAFWVMFITVRILGDVERLILQTGTKDFIRFLTSPKMRTGVLNNCTRFLTSPATSTVTAIIASDSAGSAYAFQHV